MPADETPPDESRLFAPAHLGVLTRYMPVELVDDVLERTRTVQRRLRLLPSRAGAYFCLALTLFPALGYARVWSKLAPAGTGPRPSEKALRDLRRRLGPAPMKALFEVVAGPVGQPRTPGVCFAGLRTVAFDGINSIKIPDTEGNRGWVGRIHYRLGWAGYPTLRLMTLVETGTRALLGAVIGSAEDRDEPTLARRLMPRLRPDMLVLLDRAFDAAAFFAAIDATGAKLLARGKSTRTPRVLGLLADGSYLSELGGLSVRIVEADLAVSGADGSRIGQRYRLITTLLDERRYPALDLVRIYHERWEIESAYFALRHTMLGGQVLRSGDRAGVEQEIWSMLTTYQLLRMAMVEAVEFRPGTDPDRASFTTALEAARESVLTHRHAPVDHQAELDAVGVAVLATLLPARRARYSARKVKSATSRYINREDGGRPFASTTVLGIEIVVQARSELTTRRKQRDLRERFVRATTAAGTRRHFVLNLMAAQPERTDWSGRELAAILEIPARNMLTQLAEWARLGGLRRTAPGTYALDTPP
jgi:hypothetical protein